MSEEFFFNLEMVSLIFVPLRVHVSEPVIELKSHVSL